MELSGFIPNALTYGLGNDMGNGSSVTSSLFNLPFKTVELRARFFTIMWKEISGQMIASIFSPIHAFQCIGINLFIIFYVFNVYNNADTLDLPAPVVGVL